jgi:hypothetical protein
MHDSAYRPVVGEGMTTVHRRIGTFAVRHVNAVAGATAVVILASAVLALPAALSLHASGSDLLLWPAIVAFVVAGWLLAVRLPANSVGWLLLLTSVGVSDQTWSVLSSWLLAHGIGVGRWTGAIASAFFVFIVGGLGLLLPLLFPDGRLPSQRRWWRVVLWCDIAYMFFAGFNLFDPGRYDLPGLHQKVPNPFAAGGLSHLSGLVAFCLPALLIGFAGSFGSVVTRWRAADADRREQMKWVLLALALSTLPFLLHDWALTVSNAIFVVVLPLVPVTIAVSVLRYRLYEIDRIVSRAVSYLLVTGLLVGVYVGCIALAEAALPVGSSFGVAASTLAVAALFQPVRRQVQAAVDRRFNRARYDAARTIEAFAVRLRDEVDPEVVRHDLLEVTMRAVQPSNISLWVST